MTAPELDTELHVRMLERGRERRRLHNRLRRAIKELRGRHDVYGLEWGDPEVLPPMKHVLEHYLLPYVDRSKRVLEIGPGGGRWTRYMMEAKTVYAVDYHRELLDELQRNVAGNNLKPILNSGDDFPGIPDSGVDFAFSFGTFVHVELDAIERYLVNLVRVLTTEAVVVIHYSDKTKPLAQGRSFSHNDPETMRALVAATGYEVLEEDDKSLWHSALICFRLAQGGARVA
jgi:SAM-dependent methyltransferase